MSKAPFQEPEKAIPPDVGMILILVSGLLTLFLLLGAAFSNLSEFAGAGNEGERTGRAARLAAESALDYAAARLWEETRTPADFGQSPTPENARDDWTARGPEPLGMAPARRLNPSYAHGEHWDDVAVFGVTDGAYSPNNDLFSMDDDADGNGTFTARSGRLRGAGSPRFALRIQPCASLVCINSGETGSHRADHDLDGILNRDDPDYAVQVPAGAYRDPLYPGNVHLVNLLNNLGAVLDLSIETSPDYWPTAPKMGKYETSSLGTKIVANRPAGGYTSLEEIRPLLKPADFEKAAPFLATSGELVPIPVISDLMNDKSFAYQITQYSKLTPPPEKHMGPVAPERYEFHARIDFNTAPVEVIAASLRHIASSGSNDSNSIGNLKPVNQPFIRLAAREADLIAAEMAKSRPIHTWKRFLEALHAAAPACLLDDPFTQGVDESLGDHALLKEDLILAQVMPPGYFGDPHLWRQNSLEVPRQTLMPSDPTLPRRIFKDLLTGPLCTLPYDQDGILKSSIPIAQCPTGIPSRATTEYSLASAARETWEIDAQGMASLPGPSAAADRTLRGTFHLGGSPIVLSGQLQMESPLASTAFPWCFPGRVVRAESPCVRSGAQTWPLFSRASYDAAVFPNYANVPSWQTCDSYPAAVGGIRLASRQVQENELLSDADFAVPFNEDRIGEPGTWYDATDWKDNLGCPLNGAGPGGRAAPGPTDSSIGYFHMGTLFGPSGFRARTYSTNPTYPPDSGLVFYWSDPDWTPFLPFTHVFDGATHTLEEATMTLWIPSCAKTDLVSEKSYLSGSLRIHAGEPPGPGQDSMPYLSVGWTPDGTVALTNHAGVNTVCPPPWWALDPGMARTGWHHLAVTFEGAGKVSVWSDGRLLGAYAPGGIPEPAPPNVMPKGWTIQAIAPFDDLRIFHRVLTAREIEAEARREPYERVGDYLSPTLVFDADELPKGATLRGLSWDGFIPEQTNGTVSFEVIGTDDAGGTTTLPVATWDGTGSSNASFQIPGCRQARIRVTIAAQDPEPLPLGPGGAPEKLLRDSPHVGELVLRFAGRPRWNGLAGR